MEAERLEFDLEKIDGATVITPTGPALETENVHQFWDALEPRLEEGMQLVLDLSRLDFIDSAGCGLFPRCRQTLKAKQGDLVVCSLSPKISALFRLMAFDQLFDIVADRAEALALFKS